MFSQRALAFQKKNDGSVCLTRIKNAVRKVCQTTGNLPQSTTNKDGRRLPLEVLLAVDDIVEAEFDSFAQKLQASGKIPTLANALIFVATHYKLVPGWRVSGQHLGIDEWRSSWHHQLTSSAPRRHLEKTD